MLKRDDFETIKELGTGNFTEIYQVMHKGVYFALKVCQMQNVAAKRRETDIVMEKHALNKIKEHYGSKYYAGNEPSEQVAVRLVTTFRD